MPDGLHKAANDPDRRTARFPPKKEDEQQAGIPATPSPDLMALVLTSRCGYCHWRRVPGATGPGYCARREDLPLHYGLLHELPADLGENCNQFRPRGGHSF